MLVWLLVRAVWFMGAFAFFGYFVGRTYLLEYDDITRGEHEAQFALRAWGALIAGSAIIALVGPVLFEREKNRGRGQLASVKSASRMHGHAEERPEIPLARTRATEHPERRAD
jgi:hypothetical protein